MDTTTFAAAFAAIKLAQYSDVPDTKKAASALATDLKEQVDDLVDWANDFQQAVDTLNDKADELADADADDRPDCHSEFATAAEAVADALLDLGLTEDVVMRLAPATT